MIPINIAFLLNSSFAKMVILKNDIFLMTKRWFQRVSYDVFCCICACIFSSSAWILFSSASFSWRMRSLSPIDSGTPFVFSWSGRELWSNNTIYKFYANQKYWRSTGKLLTLYVWVWEHLWPNVRICNFHNALLA